jgi:hypothetical protein
MGLKLPFAFTLQSLKLKAFGTVFLNHPVRGLKK